MGGWLYAPDRGWKHDAAGPFFLLCAPEARWTALSGCPHRPRPSCAVRLDNGDIGSHFALKLHAALVSEADFVAAQDIRAPRGNPQPGRRYRLAGLLQCGICGRRMESCWANNRAAYRCRHGNTSASAPDRTRRKNLYIREDRILAHLPALYILLDGTDPPSGILPPTATEVISQLREREIVLIYEPETRTLRTNMPQDVKITIDPAR